PATVGPPPGGSLEARVESWERQELLQALEATRWNVARAAARLGLTRGTIRYRIEKYDLAPPSRRAPRRRSAPAPTVESPPSTVRPVPATRRWEQRRVAP